MLLRTIYEIFGHLAKLEGSAGLLKCKNRPQTSGIRVQIIAPLKPLMQDQYVPIIAEVDNVRALASPPSVLDNIRLGLMLIVLIQIQHFDC